MIKFWLPYTKDARMVGLSPTSAASWSNIAIRTETSPISDKCGYGGAVYHMQEDEFGEEFSFAAWIKNDSSWPSNNTIISCKNTSAATNLQWYISVISGNSFNIGINGGSSLASYSYTFNIGQWYHVAVTYDGKTYNMYINGDKVKTGTRTATKISGCVNVGIGTRSNNNGGTAATTTRLKFSDVRIYDNAISDSDVKEIFERKVFDVRGCSMTTKVVNDLGGTGTILTPKNAVKSGNTFYFNGTNAYIITSELDFMKMADSNYTFSMWINSNEADSSRSIYFGCGNQGNGWTLAFEKQANTNKFRIYNNAKPDWYVDGCVMTPNQWIHIAVTKSGDTFKVYKNGVVVGTKTGVSAHTAFDKIYYLGSDYRAGDTMFKGYIGDFKAYATALSDDEIAKIYAKNFPKEHESNGYVPTKCLRFTGQQYLNIGKLSATNSIKVELDFLPENNVFNQPTFLGVSGKSIQFYRASSGTAVSVWTSGKSCKFGDVVYGQVNNLVFTSTASNLKHSWNGGTESNFSNTVYFNLLKGGNMLIGAYSPGTSYPFHGDIYAMRVYCDDVLRNDLISAVNSSGSVGFYDKKDGNWYFSQTSNGFELIL